MADYGIAPGAGRASSGRNVTAVLGPTNTGKTHLAIERMLGHQSGLIGLPLRLLAREVYDKIVARIGPRDVALITGEEKIKPDNPRYYVCTVEAMPRDVDVEFLAIDEIQLAADPERGHVFTERMFSARGNSETLLLGASTMQESIRDLLPGANFVSRPRLSKLTYSGQKKITRLPRRSAIVAFSATEVYEIAELIRRQRGGAAVVIGALSPRTRNAQVALYQSGDVDFLVATDAIGMGLNLDVDHVAFAGTRKFDGRTHRQLTAGELGQIAGRAGRYMNDGSFGVTGDVEPFPQEMVDKLENHSFDPIKILQWRNSRLDFASIEHLMESLREQPTSPRLTRARSADDVVALEAVLRDDEVKRLAGAPAAVRRLWDACQIPDYRKISAANHAELVAQVYKFTMSDEGVIPEEWFDGQVAFADRTDGDIDTLSTRISHIRTWTFVSQKREWLANPDQWQARTREIEDQLSDALHERLTQRFVDKRTSVLMKTLRDSDTLYADIEQDGKIMVEQHYVGKLEGFRFTPDAAASGVHGKAARSAAVKILASELSSRAEKLTQSADEALVLDRRGKILWSGHEIGQLDAGDDPLKPVVTLLCDEHLQANDKIRVLQKVNEWVTRYIDIRLKPLIELSGAEDITGLARGIAFRLRENFGVLRRDTVAEEIRALDQESRAQLRKYGVRFGAHNIYFPLLLKPSPSDLLLLLWALKHGPANGVDPRAIPDGPRQGLTSTLVDKALPEAFYRAIGFQVCGARAVRIDMLERLADLIRPLISWKPTPAQPEPPAAATGRGGFRIQPDMMSIMGCSGEELGSILTALGFQKERRVLPSPAAKPASNAEVAPEDGAAKIAPPSDPSPAGDAIAADAGAGDGAAGDDAAAGAVEAIEPQASPANAEPPTAPQAAENEAASPAAAETGIAPGAEATSGAEPKSDGAPAIEYEEIWRVRRARPERHGGHEAGRRSSKDRAQSPGGPSEGQRKPFERGGQRREHGQPGGAAPPPRSHHHDRPDQQRHANLAGEVQPPQSGAPQSAPRPDRRQDNRPERAPGQAGQASANAHQRPPQKFQPRPEKRRDQPRVITAEPKGGGANSDSPFAALLKLKEQLEQQTQDQR